MTARERPIRVFIDSSVLMAAAISNKGKARDLLKQGFHGKLTLLVSPIVFKETANNLARKAPQALPTFELVQRVLPLTSVNPSKRLVSRIARIVEAKDAPIVAAALLGGADYLASYDKKHLLSIRDVIGSHFGVVVATPDEILASLS